MARPKPKPEDAKDKTSVSLSVGVIRAAKNFLSKEGLAGADNFSHLVSQALTKYISVKYPTMIDDARADIRMQNALKELPVEAPPLMAAEDPPAPPVVAEESTRTKKPRGKRP